jgi:AcrR family transcriptional regulator
MARAHDDTSAALLTAAHRLLAGEGPEALTVRRIAAEAGMSTMNVYSRFGGKDGVLDELHRDGFERLITAIEVVPHTSDRIGDLVAVAHAYREFAVSNPRYYEIMFGTFSTGPSPSRQLPDGLERYVVRLEQAVADDLIELPDGLDPRATAVWMWALCHGMVSLELNALAVDPIDWPRLYDAGVRAAVLGLSTRVGLRSPGS